MERRVEFVSIQVAQALEFVFAQLIVIGTDIVYCVYEVPQVEIRSISLIIDVNNAIRVAVVRKLERDERIQSLLITWCTCILLRLLFFSCCLHLFNKDLLIYNVITA
jgi:hypothetical protein